MTVRRTWVLGYIELREHWRRRGAVQTLGPTYVRRVLVNSTIDESRRPWRREEPGLGGIDRPDRELFAAEDRMAIMAALAALSAGQRRVVVLRYYVGLSVEETAADLDITPSTVKSQCSRGLARLNELLTAQFRA